MNSANIFFGIEGIAYSIPGLSILNGVDFHVAPGEMHALVGKHNEGKSTFGKILSGALKPRAGKIVVSGRAFSSLSPRCARDIGIEYVGGDAMIYPELTVADNLLSGTATWRRQFSFWQGALDDINVWIQENGIQLPYEQTMTKLRKDDWVFVEILNRLYRRPKLLILDEMLEQLRPVRFREAMRIIREQRNHGMALLWITHRIEEALEHSDRVTVLRQGRILFSDKPGNLDRVSLLRLSYADLGEQEGEEIRREQFYELINLMEAVMRDMPVAVVAVDLAGRVRFANNSGKKMFSASLSSGEIPLKEFFGDENRHLLACFDEVVEKADSVWLSQSANLLQGRNRLVDLRIRTVQENDVRIGTILIIEDVTEREELRQGLAFSENLASVGLLAAGVAHEVNDPLAIISNYLGFIRHETGNEQIVSAANLAQEETIRIRQIVDNLIAFSGNAESVVKTVDLCDLIRDLTQLLRFHIQGRTIRFVLDLPGHPLLIRANLEEMRQVFLNLFKNSFDAIAQGGEIRVNARADEAEGEPLATVVLSDDGPGIQLENPNDVFKPFVTTKKGKGKHQGLGLAIVYGIVEKYNGSIQARNLPVSGCEFTLRFPGAGCETHVVAE